MVWISRKIHEIFTHPFYTKKGFCVTIDIVYNYGKNGGTAYF